MLTSFDLDINFPFRSGCRQISSYSLFWMSKNDFASPKTDSTHYAYWYYCDKRSDLKLLELIICDHFPSTKCGYTKTTSNTFTTFLH